MALGQNANIIRGYYISVDYISLSRNVFLLRLGIFLAFLPAVF